MNIIPTDFSDLNLGYLVIPSLFIGYFLGVNFYLVGLYLDYLFKIYYHLNSSLDRMIYRLLFGATTVAVIVALLKLVGFDNYVNYFCWALVFINLIFSIYPTSAKLVFSSVTSNLGELKHLENMEKVLLSIFLIYFIFSTPNVQFIRESGVESFFTHDLFHQANTFSISIFPSLPLESIILGYFYYFFGALYYLISYSFLRFFFSRRVSIIGILAIITNWNLIKLVYGDFSVYATSIYLIAFLWSIIWVNISKSYRTNLFFGMVLVLSSHHPTQISISLLLIGLLSIFLTSNMRTKWAKIQSLKYMSLGLFLTLFFIFNDFSELEAFTFQSEFSLSFNLFFKKAFNIISFVGLPIFIYFFIESKLTSRKRYYSFLNLPNQLMFSVFYTLAILLLSDFGNHFDIFAYIYFIIVLICLPALELVLNALGQFHPKKNLIFFLYILFTILDSHFESRVKTFFSLF